MAYSSGKRAINVTGIKIVTAKLRQSLSFWDKQANDKNHPMKNRKTPKNSH